MIMVSSILIPMSAWDRLRYLQEVGFYSMALRADVTASKDNDKREYTRDQLVVEGLLATEKLLAVNH
jgi:hypothetical protein